MFESKPKDVDIRRLGVLSNDPEQIAIDVIYYTKEGHESIVRLYSAGRPDTMIVDISKPNIKLLIEILQRLL